MEEERDVWGVIVVYDNILFIMHHWACEILCVQREKRSDKFLMRIVDGLIDWWRSISSDKYVWFSKKERRCDHCPRIDQYIKGVE